jgi:hypothetical protein
MATVASIPARPSDQAVSVARAGVVLLALLIAGCGTSNAKPPIRHLKEATSDPPLLVPWNRIGNIALGEPRARVEREYGSVGHGFHVIQRYGNNVQGYYRVHRSQVVVTYYGERVGELIFGTPYYRTTSGFGVGSRIPLGPCHKTAEYKCEHRWHGFVWNEWIREKPCSCWTKVGLGRRSLPLTVDNFLKPWFFIDIRHGRVDSFYFALKFVD